MQKEKILLTVNYFKPHGKWYTEETIEVPQELTLKTSSSIYELRNWLMDSRPYKNEFIMVITDDEAIDYIGFPMLDLPE